MFWNKLKVGHKILILFNIAYIIAFTVYYSMTKNYEFLLYIGVVVILLILVVSTFSKTKFDYTILWLLSIWGFLHMLGGGLIINGEVLYRLRILNIFQGMADPDFFILKFDQVMHFYIYFVMSLVMFHLIGLMSNFKANKKALMFFAFLASIGVGSLNELVEFGAVVFLGKTGVGGYYNTALDIVFNTLGGLVGAIAAYYRR